jgi:competence protein ComEA
MLPGFLRWVFLIVLSATASPAQLKSIGSCTLVPTEWADGDSFRVRLPDGKEMTLRLYGVDCIEIHMNGDDSNARRLRDQRRYFGIPEIGIARQVGEAARAETLRLLSKPFTVHTAMADGRGDARFERFYAFVQLADGRDLAETLTASGLARAFGVYRQRPDGSKGGEWQEHLRDLELTAARKGVGAWKHTDWSKLPDFRAEARRESAEIEEATDGPMAGENKPVDINRASRGELESLPGIGKKTANDIIANRPYRSVNDLDRVPGIGPARIAKLRPYVRISP